MAVVGEEVIRVVREGRMAGADVADARERGGGGAVTHDAPDNDARTTAATAARATADGGWPRHDDAGEAASFGGAAGRPASNAAAPSTDRGGVATGKPGRPPDKGGRGRPVVATVVAGVVTAGATATDAVTAAAGGVTTCVAAAASVVDAAAATAACRPRQTRTWTSCGRPPRQWTTRMTCGRPGTSTRRRERVMRR